jgi:hypothetical protein
MNHWAANRSLEAFHGAFTKELSVFGRSRKRFGFFPLGEMFCSP